MSRFQGHHVHRGSARSLAHRPQRSPIRRALRPAERLDVVEGGVLRSPGSARGASEASPSYERYVNRNEQAELEAASPPLYEYTVESPGGETFSMEALLRVEAELERLREQVAEYERVERSDEAKKWPHWIPLFKYERTLKENERLREELEPLRKEHA